MARANGLCLRDRIFEDRPGLDTEISRADVVVIHWWNHPLLNALLTRETLPPARVALWSHVSGHEAPQIFTRELASFPDRFVIASPYSLETPIIRDLNPDEKAERVRLVFSCAGTDHIGMVRPVPHEGFRVGYVGTVDYCKMHRDFVSMSAAADIPGAVFVVCGGPMHEEIMAEAIRSGAGNRFDFRGHVADVAGMLATFDVFGYPLAPTHYGTGEQTLIEALAAGVPTVVLNNGAESFVVEDGRTGLVADDPAHYTACLELLSRRPDLARELGQNARRYAVKRFTIARTAEAWREVYEELMVLPKREHVWPAFGTSRTWTPAEVFMASLGDRSGPFRSSLSASKRISRRGDEEIAGLAGLYRARTRGSVFHYRTFFPDDPWLKYWCEIMTAGDDREAESERNFTGAVSEGVGVTDRPSVPFQPEVARSEDGRCYAIGAHKSIPMGNGE
jgi:glycosyltransferase involved in cell wall biosynthesis